MLDSFLILDEIHFHLSSFVNKQNCCYWAENTPMSYTRSHFMSQTKVTVWCTVTSNRIIGPFFFQNENGMTMTVNSNGPPQCLKFYFPDNTFCMKDTLWFQPDVVTTRAAQLSMLTLQCIPQTPYLTVW